VFFGEYDFKEKNAKDTYIFKNDKVRFKGDDGFSVKINGKNYAIIFTGEIYNRNNIKKELNLRGFSPKTDSELLLLCYYASGLEFINKLDGVFSFAIYDDEQKTLLLARDHLGVMPLFYTFENGFSFSSNLDCLIQKEEKIGIDSLREIFGIGPARTPGTTAFKHIKEILPGSYAHFISGVFSEEKYFKLTPNIHIDDFETTIEKIKYMVTNSIQNKINSDTCSLLSGGIDSTIVTTVANNYSKSNFDTKISTFSFDYVDNKKYFVSGDFQPGEDRPFVEIVSKKLETEHTFLEIGIDDLISYLYKAVDAKALPGMGDIDSSLLFFLEKIKQGYSSFLTGEGADEVFGGYPWFIREDLINSNSFPWSNNIHYRTFFIDDEVKNKLDLKEYTEHKYRQSLNNSPSIFSESPEEKRLRDIYYLNTQWFMQTLIERTQRISKYLNIIPRMPYANAELVQYVYNIPWYIKTKDNVTKYTLRKAFENTVPKEIVYRKKSPFPKTYNPKYTEELLKIFRKDVLNKNSALYPLLNIEIVNNIEKEHTKPWFGQLMQGPQQLAYLIQINYWIEKYNISIKI